MLAKVRQVFPPIRALGGRPAGNVAGFVENIDGVGLFPTPAIIEGGLVGIVEGQNGRAAPRQIFERGEVLLGLFAFLFADALGGGPDGIDKDDIYIVKST